MSSGVPINSARCTVSFAAGAVQDDDGVKTSFATVAAPVTLVSTDFNGAVIRTGGKLNLPRSLTISRSSASNQYSVNPIVVTGLYGGRVVTESFAQANDDGNDVIRGTQAFDTITSIAIPTNAGTGGAYKIGVQDICAPAGGYFSKVAILAAGTLNVQYGEATGSPTDALVFAAEGSDTIAPTRILTSTALSSPTTVGVRVYLP